MLKSEKISNLRFKNHKDVLYRAETPMHGFAKFAQQIIERKILFLNINRTLFANR